MDTNWFIVFDVAILLIVFMIYIKCKLDNDAYEYGWNKPEVNNDGKDFQIIMNQTNKERIIINNTNNPRHSSLNNLKF